VLFEARAYQKFNQACIGPGIRKGGGMKYITIMDEIFENHIPGIQE